MILALAGGVGGAKLAHGLAGILPQGELIIVVNTGDDFEHLDLHISPDLDTVMYTLAGIADRERGWGQADESWNFMAALKKLGGEDWFNLGDKDLATHVERTRLLRAGRSLSQVTEQFCARLGIQHPIIPMSDAPVRTIVHSVEGDLPFQEYFVHRRCEPVVTSVSYAGADAAHPSRGLIETLESPDLSGIVICPSNPYLSIAPVLAVTGVRQLLQRRRVPAIAVSPIIGGRAVKGPAAKMLHEMGVSPTPQSVAELYSDIIDGFVVDTADAKARWPLANITRFATDALMRDEGDRQRLAREVLDFLKRLRRG